MNRPLPKLLLLTVLACGVTPAVAQVDGDVPAAPLAATSFHGWTNAYRLQNSALSVTVVPETGRIASLGFIGGPNALRVDPGLAGKTVPGDAPDYWFNFGGDWIWPVAQDRWPDFQGEDWPPSRLLDGRPWQGRAWKSADGGQCCLLTQEYGEPLHIKVTRFIKLHGEHPSLSIRQKIERTAASPIPVVLWNISQTAGAEEVILPTDDTSAFEGGIKAIRFGMPGDNVLKRCDRAAVYQVRGRREYKLGSDSPRAWIASRKGDMLVVESAGPYEEGESYPDDGCTVEMYSNAGLGYTEIETCSPEKFLAPGEVMENTLRISCYRIMPDLAPCELAAKVSELIGESPVTSVLPPEPEPAEVLPPADDPADVLPPADTPA
jgi:hypothetical protein